MATKVLGSATYSALRSPLEGIVTLTARGVLPCFNYRAELEQRPEKILPPMWQLVFWVEDVCLRAIKPFEVSVVVHGAGSRPLRVLDATGWVEVPITDPFVPVDLWKDRIADDAYLVYARLPVPENGELNNGCMIVPEGTIVPAIYYSAFGPSSKAECQKWLTDNCSRDDFPGWSLRGGEVPWPKADNVEA